MRSAASSTPESRDLPGQLEEESRPSTPKTDPRVVLPSLAKAKGSKWFRSSSVQDAAVFQQIFNGFPWVFHWFSETFGASW